MSDDDRIKTWRTLRGARAVIEAARERGERDSKDPFDAGFKAGFQAGLNAPRAAGPWVAVGDGLPDAGDLVVVWFGDEGMPGVVAEYDGEGLGGAEWWAPILPPGRGAR